MPIKFFKNYSRIDIQVWEPRFDRAQRGTGTCDVAGVSCRFVGSEM